LGKLKEKKIVSQADLEAERQQKETAKQEYLVRCAKRRAEVKAENDDGFKWETSNYVFLNGQFLCVGDSKDLWVPKI